MSVHPELGYYDQGIDLAASDFYRVARLPFGEAALLPAQAYTAANFGELEDEKIWTRAWIYVGSQLQIPSPGDLLPYTIGNHGIHLQRDEGGELIGRFNKAQHGGCRSIPLQCQTGKKTKCSFTSCGFSRDREVIPGGELESELRLMGQYLGDRPERLLPVRLRKWGPLMFANLHEEPGYPDEGRAVSELVGPWLRSRLLDAGGSCIESAANWKLVGRALMVQLPSVIACGDVAGHVNQAAGCPSAVAEGDFSALTVELGQKYLAQRRQIGALPPIAGLPERQLGGAVLCWVFPNLLLILMPDHIVSIGLQPTATTATFLRLRLFVDPAAGERLGAAAAARLVDFWADVVGGSAEQGERIQKRAQDAAGPNSRRGEDVRFCLEDNHAGYAFQQFVIRMLLRDFRYQWSAPLYRPRAANTPGAR